MKTEYTKSTKSKFWRFALVGMAGLGLSLTAGAQDAASDDENLEELEGFIVTGSLIKRTDMEGPAPVLSITREDIETSGFQQVSDLIRSLPLNNGLTEADATASFAADGAYANLRGIGPGGTLVLVNGRRLAPYGAADFNGRSFVDLNAFPPAAIERVDVLKTGASAIYGSDALGGAINIILRKDYEGLEVNAYYGNTTRDGDFGTTNLSATLGTSSDKGSIIIVANYLDRKPMYMNQRDFDADGYYGIPFDDSSTLADDGVYFFGKTTRGQGRGGLYEGFNMSSAAYPGRFDIFTPNDGAYYGGYLFAGDGSDADGELWQYANYNDFITSISAAERKGLVAMGTYEITDNVEFFLEGNYQANYAWTQFAPAPNFFDTTVAADNPYNPTNPANTAYYRPEIFTRVGLDPADYPNGDDLDMVARVTDPGNRLFETYSDFLRVLAGATIDVGGGWTVEPSFMYVESRLEDITRNLLVIDTYQEFLDNTETSATSADPTTWAINPFATGPGENDNHILYNEYVKADDTRLSRSELNLWEIRGAGPVISVPGGDLMMAVGAEMRSEKLEDRPSLASQQGQLIGSGGTSSSGVRDAWAAYVEVTSPIFELAEVQAAVRYEDYDDFGDTGFKPQIGVKFDPIDTVSVRVAYADNFKAPSLAQAYAGVQRGFLQNEDLIRYPITGDAFDGPAQQKESRTGGNPNLVPEESESFSAGVIFAPEGKLEGLEIAVDYWKIEASQLITTTSEGQILQDEFDAYTADPAAFLALSPTDRLAEYNVLRRANENFGGQTIPGAITYINSVYLNLDALDVEGFDVDVSYTWATDNIGTFRFNTFWVWYGSYEEANSGINEVGTFRLPKWRGTASVSWDYADWSVAGLAYYVDKYEDLTTFAAEAPQSYIDSYTTFDLRVTYSGFYDTEITVGIDNLFDSDPPFMNYDNSGYDPAFADPIGRFLWMAVKKSF